MESVVNDTPAGSQSSLFELPVDVSLDPNSSTSMTSSIVLIIDIINILRKIDNNGTNGTYGVLKNNVV
jgi:hypothetical protein